MLGISLYFQDMDVEYLKEAAKRGAKYVFTSLHIPEEDYSDLDQKMPIFLKTCKELDLEIVPDISPVTFEKLKLKANDYAKLKELGFQSLRLDYGFDDFEVIKTLLKDFHLMLNASIVKRNYLVDAMAAGVDFSNITLTHNFYPHSQTGLGLEYFNQMNEPFREFGLRIQAFVCGDELKRYPVYEGLPTLERHRQMHPYVAAVELIKTCGVNDVMIGDSKATLETLEFIVAYMKDKTMHIKAHFEAPYQDFYERTFTCRKDMAEHIIRIVTPRTAHVKVYHNNYRRRGSITMDNELFGRYSGEVQLIKKDFDMDARVNVIGFIHPDYVDLMELMDGTTQIKFVKI